MRLQSSEVTGARDCLWVTALTMESYNNTTESQDWSGNATTVSEVALIYQIIGSLLLAALILFAILGNACVIAAIALERSLQNVANYLIGSLAVTDLMVSVLVLPMAALYQVLNKWTLGQEMCDIFISLDVLCCTSSILHLCAIALDRYWAITDPIDYVNKRTPRRAAILISLTWLIGFSISIPPMLGWRKPEDRADPDACTISQDHGYTIYSTFGAFYIPLILMLVLYGRIFRAARFRIRKTVKKTDKAKIADKCLAVSPALFPRKANGEVSKTWRRSVEPQPRTVRKRNTQTLGWRRVVRDYRSSDRLQKPPEPAQQPSAVLREQEQEKHGCEAQSGSGQRAQNGQDSGNHHGHVHFLLAALLHRGACFAFLSRLFHARVAERGH